MSISRQFMYFAGEYIYIWNSFILQANIYISRQFMYVAREYIYIYIYMEFINIAGDYLYI